MTAWPGRIGAITLFVEDLGATKTFYRSIFGLPVLFEDADSVVFDFGDTLINLLKATAATELIKPATVATAGSGTRAQLTIEVEDVDAVALDVVTRGAELLNGPVDRPWGVRTACFADPSGHVWEIAHPLT